ncbi:hypothetical protein GCM10022261_12050 [Brevibacterium daeguense]|uniref:DUF4145 domain-containing protein n=2 Tax=Brevibacterium daeguense TaxID=909936 RepID=A0ABP8EI85_9MICO
MTPRWGRISKNDDRIQFAASCDYCAGLVVAETGFFTNSLGENSTQLGHVQALIEKHPGINWSWRPRPELHVSFEHAPEHIEQAAVEAHSGRHYGNYMSAILMARTVIEATAKHLEKDKAKGNLFEKIDMLLESGHITKRTAEFAHAIRQIGNDMAHGDISEPVEAIDAEQSLRLMDEVLADAFEYPAIHSDLLETYRERKQQRGQRS